MILTAGSHEVIEFRACIHGVRQQLANILF